MHVLHRPHQLHRAALAAVAAAVLAIVLTLAIAGGLNDVSSASTAGSVPTSHAAVHAAAIGSQASNPLTHSAFTGPFPAPVRVPWASAAR